MKKVTWMEIAIAMPMVLAFVSFGGIPFVIVATVLMLLVMSLVKWGNQIRVKERRKVQVVVVNR